MKVYYEHDTETEQMKRIEVDDIEQVKAAVAEAHAERLKVFAEADAIRVKLWRVRDKLEELVEAVGEL